MEQQLSRQSDAKEDKMRTVKNAGKCDMRQNPKM